jgi:naphthoate synthase
MSEHRNYETILYREEGPVGILTLNRPHDGNMFTPTTCVEVRDCLEAVRCETRTRVIVLTGAGDKFFCIGGHHDALQDTRLYPGAPRTLEMYDAIERLQKPVIASVNGYAVGGGHVLHVVCDLTIAKESAIFRQVGPMVGSFDAGYGTWYLEDLIGKKRAKEMWFRNPKLTAAEALEWGLINKVVPDADLARATMEMALEISERGSVALAGIKAAFRSATPGSWGPRPSDSRLHAAPLLCVREAKELSDAFANRRKPDPSKFGH